MGIKEIVTDLKKRYNTNYDSTVTSTDMKLADMISILHRRIVTLEQYVVGLQKALGTLQDCEIERLKAVVEPDPTEIEKYRGQGR